MVDDEKNLITKDQFNANVKVWTDRVRLQAKATLQMETRGDGDLEKSLTSDLGDTNKYAVNRIAFAFKRYGVYRHYGVGRGYVIQNGVLMRGYKPKKGTEIYAQLWKKGYSRKELNQYKVYREAGSINRKPLNWLDGVIEKSISALADMAGEYYGDRAAGSVLENQGKIKIEKHK